MTTDSERYYAEEIEYSRLEWSIPQQLPCDSPKSTSYGKREVFWAPILLSPFVAWPWAWQIWRAMLIWTGQVPPVADGTGAAPTLLSDSTVGIADQLGLFIDICIAVAIVAVGMYLLHKIAAGLRRVVG